MPDGFRLRFLRAEDEPFLWEMLYQAIYVPDGQPRPPREIVRRPELARYVSGWGAKPGDYGVLAEPAITTDYYSPVGAAWLRLFSAQGPGYGYVADDIPELSIAVLSESRGQGLGTSLIKGLLQTARERYDAVSLSVSPGNPAFRLYERLGFQVVAQDGSAITMLFRFGLVQ